MRYKLLIILLILVPTLIHGASTINPLTKPRADTLYCSISGGCAGGSMDYTYVQNYTVNECPAGEYVYDRYQNGTWICRADVSGSGTDTNETPRVNAITDENCTGTDKSIGFQTNGTIVCSVDVDTDTTIGNCTDSGICPTIAYLAEENTFTNNNTISGDNRLYFTDANQYMYSSQAMYIDMYVPDNGRYNYISGDYNLGSWQNDKLVIGGARPTYDYWLVVDGEDNDCNLKCLEDENMWDWFEDIYLSSPNIYFADLGVNVTSPTTGTLQLFANSTYMIMNTTGIFFGVS